MKHDNDKGMTLLVLIITVTIMLFLAKVVIDLTIDKDVIDEVNKISNNMNNKVEQEKEIINTWNNLPGQPVKSPTVAE